MYFLLIIWTQHGKRLCICKWKAQIDLHMLSVWSWYSPFEPAHDKTNKIACAPAKTQISQGIHPVWSESLLSAWGKLESLATHWVQSEDSDQTGWIARHLSFCWAHIHFVGYVMHWLICQYTGYSTVFIVSVSEQLRTWSACTKLQSVLGHCCPYMAQGPFLPLPYLP